MALLQFDSVSGESQEDFKISTKEEAIKFEQFLSAMHDNVLQCPGKIVYGLGEIFDVCQKFKKEYGSRIFTAIIDIAISQTNCTCELDDCIKVWNKYFSAGNPFSIPHNSRLLDSEKSFEGKFYIQRYLNSFILKFRAHWDKIMGLYFLVYKYDLYQKFIQAHSKKKMFLSEFENHPMVEPEVINYVKEDLTAFDAQYRTHEAHGTGRLRKFAFSGAFTQPENPIYDIINEKYGKYTVIAPKIFQCVSHFLVFPEVIERLKETDHW